MAIILYDLLSLCVLSYPTSRSCAHGFAPTIINVGTGADTSYLVIDESTLYSTPLELIYHYTYDSNNLLSGYDLLTNVAANSPLSVSTTFYGGGLGNALDSLAYNGGPVVAGTNAADYSTGAYWSYYNAGGTEVGYVNPVLINWNYANVGMDSRHLAPGSWDGWTFASYSDYGSTTIDVAPSVSIAAVPEPHFLALVLLSLTTLVLFTRWKYSAKK